MDVSLVGLGVENVRGFTNAYLPLASDLIVLVGPNNSGKSSLLRMLQWIFTVDDLALRGERPLSEDEQGLLFPARSTGNRARRLVLYVWISDRRYRRFRSDQDGIATLRFRLRRNRIFLNIGEAQRGERDRHDASALELLGLVRKKFPMKLVSATRTATSQNFEQMLGKVILQRLEERAIHRSRGGAPSEYRTIKRAAGEIRETLEALASPVWSRLHDQLVPGMVRTGALSLDLDPASLVPWAASQMELRVTTGPHDVLSVAPSEVGSGLQSLLEAGLMRLHKTDKGILAVEEPEAYLHPSAQRTLARALYRSAAGKTIISTHSSLFVDEAEYESVAIVKRQRVYSAQDSPERSEINTALLTGLAAEMPFSDSVLFVEGEGDRLFFEALRRRLASVDEQGGCDRLLVVDCGANNRFAPWMRIADSFRDDTIRAIRWLVVADGCDSWGELTTAIRATGRSIPASLKPRIDSFNAANSKGDIDLIALATRRLNIGLRRERLSINMLPHDLEWAILAGLTDAASASIATDLNLEAVNRNELAARLGSKAPLGLPKGDVKKPWIRAAIAHRIPDDQMSPHVAPVMQRWLSGAMGIRRANILLRRVGWMPPAT